MPHFPSFLRSLGLIALLTLALPVWAGVVVVANANVRKLDAMTVRRIYMGKVIEVAGLPVTPINLRRGNAVRQHFLADYLQESEDNYLAYWTVRRYVGKGAPPRELSSVAEVIAFVQSTPGAVAYLDEADVPASMNVVLRK